MSTREKIIVICSLLAIGYGVYNFFFTSSEPEKEIGTPESKLAALNKFVVQVAGSLASENLSETEHYVIERAKTEWPNDPLLVSEGAADIETTTETGEGKSEPLIVPVYSGYLMMGNTILAIIDGLEYEIGDALADHEDYLITHIAPDQVIIQVRGKKKKMIIPIQEVGTGN